MAADLSGQDVPMQFGDWRNIVQADEGMVPNPDKRRRLFHSVVRVQIVLGEIHQLPRAPRRCEREKQILGGDQNNAAARPLECVRGPDLCEYVVTVVRRRRTGVLLGPTRRESVGETKILVEK